MTTVVIVIDRTALLKPFEPALLRGLSGFVARVRGVDPTIRLRIGGYGVAPDFKYADLGAAALTELHTFTGLRGHYFHGVVRTVEALDAESPDPRTFVLSVLSTTDLTGDPTPFATFQQLHRMRRAQRGWRFGILGIGLQVVSKAEVFGFPSHFALTVASREDAIVAAFDIYAGRVIALNQAADHGLFGGALTVSHEARNAVAPRTDDDWYFANRPRPAEMVLDWDAFEKVLAGHSWYSGHSDDPEAHRLESAGNARVNALHVKFRQADPLRADALYNKYRSVGA